MWKLPAGASFVLERLHKSGFQAYVVGGCVRDTILGLTPKDWDVCTDALPDEMQRVFGDCHVIETGLKHGTLTVMYEHEPYEVTTFRVDGAYTDHRHPDEVIFVRDVRDDLARRDFTVNAMAWSPQTGLVDAFGGQTDLQKGVIRAVGDAKTRFTEDALRILRALRFASVYGFTIEAETARAAHELAPTLKNVAAERIRVELGKLLCGRGAGEILRTYRDIIFTLLPALKPMDGFDQHTPHHRFDVWEHTVRAVEAVDPTETLRLTMLLHDAGKPASFHMDEDGVGHAWDHQLISEKIAREVLTQLRVDNATLERVTLLVREHSVELRADRRLLLRLLNRMGEEAVRQLIDVRLADYLAKGTNSSVEIGQKVRAMRDTLDDLIAENACFKLKDMVVSGKDLLALGIPKGRSIGACLTYLLEEILAERLPNDRETLLKAAQEFAQSGRMEQ